MRGQPVEQFGILRRGEIARQRLEEVVVRADEPRQQHQAARVHHLVGVRRERGRRADRLDRVPAQQDSAVGVGAARVVEGRDEGRVAEKQRANGNRPAMTSIAALNAADRATFVAAVGFAFENSPWIAEAAWDRRPFAGLDDLHAALTAVVMAAPPERQEALIAAHPDLAGRVAREGRLTAASRGEQAGAGLDRLTAAEIARFDDANAAYSTKFGFPFVICARRHDTASILAALDRRVHNGREAEIETALAEIAMIARLRLEDAITA